MIKLYKHIIRTVLIIGTCSCYMYKPVFPLLDYSWSSNWQYSYSLKVDDNGKAFLRKNDLKTDSFFVNTKIDVNELNILMTQIAKAKLDSQYIQCNIEDAASFKVMIYPKKGLPAQYNVYGDHYPRQLKELESYCRKLSEEKGWLYLKDTTIVFSSAINTYHIKTSQVRFPPPLTK